MPVVGRACTLLLVAGFGACLAQGAGATDFNAFSAAPGQPQGPDWAGFYLRGNPGGSGPPGGLSWANPGSPGAFSSFGAASPAVNDSFGYNFQSGNFVFGLEGSLSAANFDGRFTSPFVPTVGAWAPNMNWVGTVTGRVGYSFGQWLPYVKGGFAAADIASPLQNTAITNFSESTADRGGWTAGVGLEYQLSSKLSLGLEYLYTDIGGNANGSPNAIGSGGSPDMYSTALKTQSLLGRLNYKTGW